MFYIFAVLIEKFLNMTAYKINWIHFTIVVIVISNKLHTDKKYIIWWLLKRKRNDPMIYVSES